jgi:hypothetical protein
MVLAFETCVQALHISVRSVSAIAWQFSSGIHQLNRWLSGDFCDRPSHHPSKESSDALGCRLCELLLLLLLFFRRLSSGLCCLQGNTLGSEAGTPNSWWETTPTLSGALVSGKKTVRNQPETTSQTTSQTLKAPLKHCFSWILEVAGGSRWNYAGSQAADSALSFCIASHFRVSFLE